MFGPKDISAMRLVCGKCRNHVGWSPASCQNGHVPKECPSCLQRWENSDAKELLRLLRCFARDDASRGFSVHLEVAPE